MTALWGFENKVMDSASIRVRVSAGEEWLLATTWVHQLSPNLRMLWTDNYNLCKAFCGGNSGEKAREGTWFYNYGVRFEYTF